MEVTEMNVGLLVAGIIAFVCAAGHATVGLRWVLPIAARQPYDATPVGPAEMTHGMLRVSWHLVTVMLVAFGVLLTALARDTPEVRTLVLRWFAGLWLAGAVVMVWTARRRLRGFLRLPVPLFMIAVAAICWRASV
jgi:hypothetical protein